jgi:Mrp family chromosome partitioning ATPase
MVMGALEKLIRGTAWPELDLLLIDMPPGAPLPQEGLATLG